MKIETSICTVEAGGPRKFIRLAVYQNSQPKNNPLSLEFVGLDKVKSMIIGHLFFAYFGRKMTLQQNSIVSKGKKMLLVTGWVAYYYLVKFWYAVYFSSVSSNHFKGEVWYEEKDSDIRKVFKNGIKR